MVTVTYVYILECADGSYYVGTTQDLARRIEEHRTGVIPKAYTASRRPVHLVWSQDFPTHDEAFNWERRLKGWSHAKKSALISSGPEGVHVIMRRQSRTGRRSNTLT